MIDAKTPISDVGLFSRRGVWVVLIAAAATLHVARLFDEVRRFPSPRDASTWQKLGVIRFQDEASYYVHCADGVHRDGLRFLRNEEILRSPPAPWLWLSLWGRNVTLTRLANIGLVLIGTVMIASVARMLAGPRAAAAAFVLAASGYQVTLFSGTVLSEPLAFFFLCAATWCFARHAHTGQPAFLWLTGLACGGAALSRAAFQLLPLALIVAAWASSRRPSTHRFGFGGLRGAAWFLVAYAAIVLPWMLLNKANHGVTRLANGFGAVMFLGSDLRTDGDEPVFRGMQWQTGNIGKPYTHMQTEGDRRLMRAALHNIRAQPLAWVRLCAWKVGRVLIGGPQWHFFPFDKYRDAKRHYGRFAARGALYWWTLAGSAVTYFGLAGLLRGWRRGGMEGAAGPVAVFGLVTVAYIVGLHAVSYALPRFAMPMQGILALGCVLYASSRPRATLTVSLVAACVATTLWLAYYRASVPQSISSDAPTAGFTTDVRVRAERSKTGFRVNCPSTPLPFNATFFVQVRANPPRDARSVQPVLIVTPRWATGDPAAENANILIGIPADGRTQFHRFCVELNGAWRGRVLSGLDFSLVPTELEWSVEDVVLAH